MKKDNNSTGQETVLKSLTDDQWKIMSDIGYPYAPGNEKAHEFAKIPDMIYWRLAAGFISLDDAVRAFSTTGYTVSEDLQRTREILAELNSQYGKLDSDFNSLVSVKKPQLSNFKEEIITMVGNDYKRESNFGPLFIAETTDYGHIERHGVVGISIHDGVIDFMGINAPKSWEALTPEGQQEVCQWVRDNLELTRQLPDMLYQALDVLDDADKAVGKHKEGYDMFKRLRDEVFSGDSKAIPSFPFSAWAGKVSNDFRFFILPTDLETSSHYRELADALAIMPHADIEKFVKEVENHPQRKEVCMAIEERNNLREAKGYLRSVLDDAQADLGNTYKISPLDINMGNWTAYVDAIEYNPEYDLDYCFASGIDQDGGHRNIQILKLDNISSISELTKAIHDAHVNHLEQVVKQAIHDRIAMPWARTFTPDQIEALKRYHQVVSDIPASEVLSHLLNEVAQEPDIARKPEKWVTDTAKELYDLADGITREETRGLHK